MLPSQLGSGRYEVVSLINKGGMAVVLLALDQHIDNREVAIKVLKAEAIGDTISLHRFKDEARIISKLRHPHIVQIYDFGEEEIGPYLVMPYLTGGTLQDVLDEGTLPLPQAIQVLSQIGPALDYAHQKDVIHRDLKPGNILFDESGNAYLSDFGIAKLLQDSTQLTAEDTIIGTSFYMSPEQIDKEKEVELDGRSDIYALGVILFQMLAGEPPFVADSNTAVMLMHLRSPVPNILDRRKDLPRHLDEVIQIAMAKDRAMRFPTADALIDALRRASVGQPIRRPSGPLETTPLLPGDPRAYPAPSVEGTVPAGLKKRPPSAPSGPAVRPQTSPESVPSRRGCVSLPVAIGIGAGVAVLSFTILALTGAIAVRWGLFGPGRTTASPTGEAAEQAALTPGAAGSDASPSSPGGDVAGAAETPLLEGPTGSIGTEGSLRDGPDAAYPPVAGVSPGQTVRLLGRDSTGTWLYVSTAEAVKGWIALRYFDPLPYISDLQVIEPSAPPPTSVPTATIPPLPASFNIAGCGGSGRLVFASDRRGDTDLFLLALGSPDLGWLTDNTAIDASPAWSHHGLMVAYRSDEDGDDEIYVINADGTGKRQITNNTFEDTMPVWSPDDTRLAYVARSGAETKIFIITLDGAAAQPLLSAPGNQTEPTWSPDGARLLFASDMESEAGHYELYLVKVDGTGLEPLTSVDIASDHFPTWSPDGTQIAFVSELRGNPDLWLMDASTFQITERLTNDPGADETPAWSPNGQCLAFQSSRDGNSEIYVIAREGERWSEPVRLTYDAGYDGWPVWEP